MKAPIELLEILGEAEDDVKMDVLSRSVIPSAIYAPNCRRINFEVQDC